MSRSDASELLRAGLLEGVSVLLARGGAQGDSGDSAAAAVHAGCARLGARVFEVLAIPAGDSRALDEAALDGELERVLGEASSVEMLVVDAGELYAAAHAPGAGTQPGAGAAVDAPAAERAALGTCLEASWNLTRAVAGRAFLGLGKPGRIVYVAPSPSAGAGAEAARAGLENLARTLSIEWARRGVTAVAIAPGAATAPGEVAALVAYLASPAGAYFSGCVLDLRGPC